MNSTLKNIFLIVLLSIFNSSMLAQNLYVDIKTTNNTPGVGEKFKLTYSLKMSNGSISYNGGIQIKKPNFTNFNVVDEGSGKPGMSFGSFDFDMSLYRYEVILQPKKKGTFTIDPLTFVINGKEVKSGTVTLQVGEGDPNAKFIPKNENLFARIEVSKSNPYIGEHVLVTYMLYSRYRSISLEDFDFPMTQNLWTEEINPGKEGWQGQQKQINGSLYNVYPIKKEIVFAQTSGEIEIPAFEISARVNQSFFNMGTVEKVQSNKQTLKVKALPVGAPESFTGQVGNDYSMNVEVSTTELKANEPIDLKITIKGKGNLKQLEALKINFPNDFEVYDPESSENIKVTTSGVSGSETFSYLVIPRHRGEYSIPEIKFTYFDLATKKYKTLKHNSTLIHVEKGEAGSGAVVSNVNKEDVELINKEIHHIKLNTELTNKDDFFFGSGTFYTLLTLPFLLFIGSLIYKVKKPKSVDPALAAMKKASKQALKRLSTAQKLLEEKNDKAYFEELYKALYGYLSDKFKIPASEMDKERIKSELSSSQTDNATIENLLSVIDNCEMARFAPVSHSDAEKLLEVSKNCIQNIEKNVK